MNTNVTVTINSAVITPASSLNDLLQILGNVQKLEKKPTSKYLREQGGEPVAETADSSIRVYSCGYASYKNGSGVTVVFVPDCKLYTYEFDIHENGEMKDPTDRIKNSDEVDMTYELWTVAIALRGESQIERNAFDRKGDRGENTGSQEEAEEKDNDRVRTSSFPSPEGNYIFREEVKERLSKLTAKEQETIVWVHTYGYTHEEIADYLGIDRTTVTHRLASAEKKFGGEKAAELLLSKVA